MQLICPYCGSKKVYLSYGHVWKCDFCKKIFYNDKRIFRQESNSNIENEANSSEMPSEEDKLINEISYLNDDELNLVSLLLNNNKRRYGREYLIKNINDKSVKNTLNFVKIHSNTLIKIEKLSVDELYWLSYNSSLDLTKPDNIKSLINDNSTKYINEKIDLSVKQSRLSKELKNLDNLFNIFIFDLKLPEIESKDEKIDYIIKNFKMDFLEEQLSFVLLKKNYFNRLYNLDFEIFLLLVDDLGFERENNKMENISFIIRNFSPNDISEKLEYREKQDILLKLIKGLDTKSFNKFSSNFNLGNVKFRYNKTSYIIKNYTLEEIENHLSHLDNYNDDYSEYLSNIPYRNLLILYTDFTGLYNENDDFIVDYFLKNISLMDLEDKNNFLNEIYNLDERTLNKLFHLFDITSPTINKEKKFNLLFTYGLDKVKISLEELKQDEFSKNGHDLDEETIERIKEYKKAYLQFKNEFEEKVKAYTDFDNILKTQIINTDSLFKKVNLKLSIYDKEFRENMLNSLSSITKINKIYIEDLEKISQLNEVIPQLKSNTHIFTIKDDIETSLSDITILLNDLNDLKIDDMSVQLNNEMSKYQELLVDEKRFIDLFNEKISKFKDSCIVIKEEMIILMKDFSNLKNKFGKILLSVLYVNQTFDLNNNLNQDISSSINIINQNLNKLNNHASSLDALIELEDFEDYDDLRLKENEVNSIKEYMRENNLSNLKEDYENYKIEYENLIKENDIVLDQNINFKNFDESILNNYIGFIGFINSPTFSIFFKAYQKNKKLLVNLISSDIFTKKLYGDLNFSSVFKDYAERLEKEEVFIDDYFKNIEFTSDSEMDYCKRKVKKELNDSKIGYGQINQRIYYHKKEFNRIETNIAELNELQSNDNTPKDRIFLTSKEQDLIFDALKSRIYEGINEPVFTILEREMISAVNKNQSDARRQFSRFYNKKDFLAELTNSDEDLKRFIMEIERRIVLNYIRSTDITEEYLQEEGVKFFKK